MKRRRGDHAHGSSGPLRVVLGATLALAGDAAREELAGNDDAPAPRQAARHRRTTKLPQPHFAAAERAAPAKLSAKPARRKRVTAKPSREDAPPEAPAFADAQSSALPLAADVAGPAAIILPAEPPALQLAATRRARDGEDLIPVGGALSAAAAPTAPATDANPPEAFAFAGAQDAAGQPAAGLVEAPALAESQAAAEASAALPAPAAIAAATPLATEPAADPLPGKSAGLIAKSAHRPEAHASAGALDFAKQPPAVEAPLPAPAQAPAPAIKLAAEGHPASVDRLPKPAFGTAAPLPYAPQFAAAAPAPAPKLAAPVPAAHLIKAAAAALSQTRPAPPHFASRSFAERGSLPEPAFGFAVPAPPPLKTPAGVGMPLPGAKPALTSAIQANGGAAPGAGPQGPAPVISEDDELILQIETLQGDMSDTVVAYGLRQGVYLPLGALTRFFDLAIAVSDEGHYASGWFLDEKRTLALNLRDNTLTVAGRVIALGRADAVAYQGELYLRAERFSDIFPLDLKVDLRAQTIAVKTREPFPFEERMQREASRERLGSRAARDAGGQAQRFTREPTPWRALSPPIGEAELRALTDDDLGARIESDLRLAGDLAFMTARLYASLSTRDGLTAARLELGRRDPDGDLLGPLKATEFQLGDVSTGALPIGLRGISGRGAFVTNAPLEQASIFDSVDLRGDLADGYEVELYRNNTLVGSTRTPVNGQYAFLQVPVDFGLNVFRLVFYGPQGQRREVVRRITVGDGRLAPGQLVYSVGAAQKDVNLFAVRGPQFSPAADYGAWRATAEVGYGISRALTATFGAGLYTSAGQHHWLATAGLRSGIGATALRLDLGVQNGGGHTVEVGVGGKLLGMAYSLNHAEYGGGASDEVRAFTADPLRRATELNLNTTLHFGSGPRARTMPLTSQIRHIEFADGRREIDAALRATLPLGGLLVSNTFDYGALSAPGTASTRHFTGTFDLATLSGSRTRYRASLGYGLLPSAQLVSASLEADRRFGESTLVRAGITHTLADHQTTLGLSAARRLGPVSLAFDGSYGFPHSNFSLALRMGFSFGRNPLDGRLFIGRQGLTNGGAIALRAFADANANGRFDPGEAAVPGVTFLSGTEESHSDTAGRAFIGNLGDGNRASVRVDQDSMPDIALAPARPGIEIVPRPGRIHVSDFAIVTLSDIEGTAYFRADAGTRAVSRLQLRLLRPDGTVAAHTRSESDGFFLFERLPAGEYRLELEPQQAASLKIRLEAPVTLTIGGKSAVLRRSIYVKSAQ